MFENVKGSGNLKFVLVMLICTLVASLVVSLVVTPASLPTGGDTFTIVANINREQPYSYLVGAFSNGTYYCVNGSDGLYVTSWSSTNASAVFNNVTAVLRNTGGEICILGGQYNISSPILVSDGQHFIGQSKSYSYAFGTYLKLITWSNCSIIQPYNLTATNNDISFEMISFGGQGAAQSSGDLIYFQKCNFLVFRDCQFYESYRDCMRFETGVAQNVRIDN